MAWWWRRGMSASSPPPLACGPTAASCADIACLTPAARNRRSRWHARRGSALSSRRPGDDGRRHQEIVLQLDAERAVGGNEVDQEFVQARLEDLVDAAIAQPRVDLAGEPAAFELLLAGKLVQRADHHLIAMMQRARHVGAQDEQFGDAPRIDRVVIDAAIGAEGA